MFDECKWEEPEEKNDGPPCKSDDHRYEMKCGKIGDIKTCDSNSKCFWDQRPKTIEPSFTLEICTHLPKYKNSKMMRDSCSRLTKQGEKGCSLYDHCKWIKALEKPSTEHTTCTHQEKFSAHEKQIEICRKIKTEDKCRGNCKWNPTQCGDEKLTLRDRYNLVFNIKGSKSKYLTRRKYDLSRIWNVETNGQKFNSSDCPITKYQLCRDP